MLVMERIYPVDYRAYEIEKRELWADAFFDEMKQLHQAGFVHRDIRRPSGIGGQAFDNVLLCQRNGRRSEIIATKNFFIGSQDKRAG